MPIPFEDRITDGKIVLRLEALDPPSQRALFDSLGKLCRNWQFSNVDWDPPNLTLHFSPKPPAITWLIDPECNLHYLTAEERYGSADFDAMLATLESEVDEPIVVTNQRCPH